MCIFITTLFLADGTMGPVPMNQLMTIFQQIKAKGLEEGEKICFCNSYISAVWASPSPVQFLSTGFFPDHPWPGGGRAASASGRAKCAVA